MSIFRFRFKIDENYVGDPPRVEILISNLNDNIDKSFLGDMVSKMGPHSELNIYYHPVNNKHLGFARIVFEEVKNAKLCVERLNGKSVMGKVNMNDVFLCISIIFDMFFI